MPVVYESFKKPVINVTTDRESFVISNLGKQYLDKKTIAVTKVNSIKDKTLYTQVGNKPWIWFLLNITVILIIYLKHNKASKDA